MEVNVLASPQWGVCPWDAARQSGWSFQGNPHMVSLALERLLGMSIWFLENKIPASSVSHQQSLLLPSVCHW